MFNRDSIVKGILMRTDYSVEHLKLLSMYVNYRMDPISYDAVAMCIYSVMEETRNNGVENDHHLYKIVRDKLNGIDPFLLRKIPYEVFRELFTIRDIVHSKHYNYLKDERMDENENISILYNDAIMLENDLTLEERDVFNMHAYTSNNSLLFLHNIYIHLNKAKHYNTTSIFDNIDYLFV